MSNRKAYRRVPDEETAYQTAGATIAQLANAGRGRCIPHVRVVEIGKFYRLGELVRLPFDPSSL